MRPIAGAVAEASAVSVAVTVPPVVAAKGYVAAPLIASVPVKSGSVIGADEVVVDFVGVVMVLLLPQAEATRATTASTSPEIKPRMPSPSKINARALSDRPHVGWTLRPPPRRDAANRSDKLLVYMKFTRTHAEWPRISLRRAPRTEPDRRA